MVKLIHSHVSRSGSKTRKNILRNFKSPWCENKKEKQNKCSQKRKVDEKKVGKENKGKCKYMKRFIGNISSCSNWMKFVMKPFVLERVELKENNQV